MTKNIFVFLILISLIIISGCVNITERVEERSYPNVDESYSNVLIHELKDSNYTSGNYNVNGYVIKIYSCPPCPKGAMCKPCMGDNIIISENNAIIDSYSLSSSEIIVFTGNPKQFELGKKYKFSIKITDYKSTGEPINNIELIGYDFLE